MYKIYDTNNVQVGRIQGYKTHSLAQAQCKRRGSIRWLIRQAYEQKKATVPASLIIYLYKIVLAE